MSRPVALVVAAILLATALGTVRVLAQDGTPAVTPSFTLVERALHVSNVDTGAPGGSPGDILVWGPDPLFDEANVTDTGATTQGSCLALTAGGDTHCTETILFPDGSTLEIQGVQPAGSAPSSRTIVGGSGRYLDASGTVTITPSPDLATWTKTFEFAP